PSPGPTRPGLGSPAACLAGCPVDPSGELFGDGSLYDTLGSMSPMKIGYARVSTDEQDLTAQRDGLADLGVDPKRIYVDHGLTGRNADRGGLRQALAACRDGDTFVVTKLDRLARSVRAAQVTADDVASREVKLCIAGSVYDPTDPMGKLLFYVLAMVAEFEADLIRARTREGMKVAKAKGR